MKRANGLIHSLSSGGMVVAFLAVAALPLSVQSAPQKMNAEIHSVVIEKLELAISKAKEDETVSLKPVRARLADLYAERARLRAMDEAEKNCQDCKGALDDRKRALKMYDVVLREASKENRGPLMLQMAQLNEINLEGKKASALYEQIVSEGSKKHERRVLAEGYLGRAEAYFSKGQFEKAQTDFEVAFKLVDEGRRGLVQHRIAWCHLNKGEQKKAVRTLIEILESPELLARSSTNGAQFDSGFQEDVVRDLATFMARGDVSPRDVEMLESITPDRAKKDIMKHFANECERLGQKPSAILAWEAFVRNGDNNTERLEAMVRITQIRYDLGNKKEALADMRDAVNFWKEKGCEGKAECANLHELLRKLVIHWNRQEKKAPTGLLVDAYLVYLSKFDDDAEMTQWAALAAREQKRYQQAATLYHKASLLAAAQPKLKDHKLILESAVVGFVEMAELSKDNRTREAAYDHYLKLNPNGAIASKVRYQRAYVAYERKDMREAAERFYSFTLGGDCGAKASKETMALCVKSADLGLDALVGLKAHEVVQAHATAYAKALPARQNEYLRIARTAILKQAESLNGDRALAKLDQADLRGADQDELTRFAKTRMIAAEKAENLIQVRRSADQLLAVKGLSTGDREFALGKKAWAHEMAFEFREAYQITKRLEMKSLKADERAMKLALLAELAGLNSRSHEEEFLRLSKNKLQRTVTMAKLVRNSSNMKREFSKYESSLKAYPAVYAMVALEIYAKSGDQKFAESALRVRGVAKEPAGRMISRQLFMRDFQATDRMIARHRLSAHSERLMQKTLTERIRLLSEGERVTNAAIQSQDWSLQLISLTSMSRENKRLHDDIVGLPVPARLRGKERQQYVDLVTNSAQQYLVKHQAIEKKLGQLWNDDSSLNALKNEYAQSRTELRPLLITEMKRLADIAPRGVRRDLEGDLKDGVRMASTEDVANARRKASESPFDKSKLSRLRDLEMSRGRETMVAYLDARILKLQGDK